MTDVRLVQYQSSLDPLADEVLARKTPCHVTYFYQQQYCHICDSQHIDLLANGSSLL